MPKDSIQAEALWKEYGFVSSLVPLYRGFEMQAMQLAIAIFTVAAGFAAAALEKGEWEQLYFIGALLPWPLLPILLVVATMEVRLVRASRWVDRAIAPQVRWEDGPLAEQPVMQWEAEPSRYLTGSLEKFRPLAGAWTYAAVIAAPGVIGGATGLVGGIISPTHRAALLAISIVGLIALGGLAYLVTWISLDHESRRSDGDG